MVISTILGNFLIIFLIVFAIFLIYTVLMNKSNIKRLNEVIVLLCDRLEYDTDTLNNEVDDKEKYM